MTWRKVLLDLVVTLLLVVIFNFAAYLFLGHYTVNFGFWLAKEKWRLLTNLEGPVDWLVLGDSSANQGVMALEIESYTGNNVLNLGTFGNMVLVDDLWMLEYYLNRFGPPDKVILVHVFDMWHRSFDPVLLAQIPLPWGFWHDYTFSSDMVTDEIEDAIFIERYFPLYTQNRSLATILRTSLTTFRSPFNNGLAIDSAGYFPAYEARPEIARRDALDQVEFIRENAFAMSSINQKILDEMISLAEENGFEIYLVNSPLIEDLYQSAEFQTYLSDVRNVLVEYDQKSEHFHYVEEFKTFPAEQMQTTDHLITTGAQIFTEWLLGKVKE